jgi:hypothetical protein
MDGGHFIKFYYYPFSSSGLHFFSRGGGKTGKCVRIDGNREALKYFELTFSRLIWFWCQGIVISRTGRGTKK